MAFLMTFTASGEGRKELVGVKWIGGLRCRVERGTPWELGRAEEKASLATLEHSALPRPGDVVGVGASQGLELQWGFRQTGVGEKRGSPFLRGFLPAFHLLSNLWVC